MGSVNRLVLVGRLGRSPEMRYTPEGQALTRFSLATDRPVKAGAERETDWHQLVCWGKLAGGLTQTKRCFIPAAIGKNNGAKTITVKAMISSIRRSTTGHFAFAA